MLKRGKPCGAYLRGKVQYTRDALYVLLLMCPVNLQNKEKLAYYAVSPAHGCGGSQDEVKLAYYYSLYNGLLGPIVYCVKF